MNQTAPIDIREKVNFLADKHDVYLQDLVNQPIIQEAAILSTCNRAEVYCEASNSEFFLPWMAQTHGITVDEIKPHIYMHNNIDAVRHMMRVACGLDSMVLGEPQILGQLKSAYQTACDFGTIGSQLRNLFDRVFAISKNVRTNTAIGVNPMSIASASVQLAKRIYANIADCRVMLIGAGETIETAAHHLKECGVTQFMIANRSQENAVRLAQDVSAEPLSLSQIPTHLQHADIVITATNSALPIVGKGSVEAALKHRKHKPIFFIDLAVPRDVESQVAELEDVFLYNIDDLKNFTDKSLADRQDAAKVAEEMIELELNEFVAWQRSLEAKHIIRDYRKHMFKHSEVDLQQSLQALQRGDNSEDVVRQLHRRLVKKMIHQPSVRLRKAGYDGQEDILRLMRSLYGDEK